MKITTVLPPSRVSLRPYAPRKIWLVKSLERVILEMEAPARVRPYTSPNIFFSLGEALSHARDLTTEWIDLILTDIEEWKLDPVHDASTWESLARLEYLYDRGWPIVQERGMR